jgi:uncharacterized membrane protein
MLMAHRSGNAAFVAHTARVVVIADMLFSATAAVVQPVTGLWLAYLVGSPWGEGWIVMALGLYVFVGVFWLPVARIQNRLRDLAQTDADNYDELSAQYYRLFRIWFAAEIPAFAAMLVIFGLMISRPDISTLVLW